MESVLKYNKRKKRKKMETIRLTIYSHDKDYSLALGEALSVFRHNFIVKICGDESELVTGNDFDLLLLDSDITNEKLLADKRVIRLVESRSDVVCDINSMTFTIHKYAAVRELSANILLYYSLYAGKNDFLWNSEETKVVAFCGAAGGIGKTTIALAICQAIRRFYAKRVLYISMEEVESTLLYMREHNEGLNLGSYLYHLLKDDKKRPDSGAFMLTDNYGVNAFMPDKGINRLRELTSNEMNLFFKEISSSGGYDYIIIDLGESFSEKVKWIFKICNRIVVISHLQKMLRNERGERFLKYLRFVTGKTEDDIFVNVINMVKHEDEILEALASESIDDESIQIEYDPESITYTDELTEISLDQDFGTGIKMLLKKII